MTTSDDWERLKDLFEEALARESLDERRDFLDRHCGEDGALRSELESLLDEHSRMSVAFLEQEPVEWTAHLHEPKEGSLLGSYRLERQLGRGGMGTVYVASRADGAFEKHVAIKLLDPAGTSDELVRRFIAERQILARLDHPNIARLIDGGATEQGRPYLVMEYVDGIPIDRYCRERSLPLDKRLELFRRVCEAVAYANEHMVIHRDIKPTNILVTADGVPKLLDFGIAKVLRSDPESLEARTMLLWGTPEFASPEQLSGQTITKATDVYSLGVLLYELLTDRSPYGLASRAVHQLVRVVCEEDPEPPSRAVIRDARGNKPVVEQGALSEEVRLRSKRLRGDLDNIAMTALRKEPQARYENAAQLAQDISRHVQGLPIQGCATSWRYRVARFLGKRARTIGVAAMIVLGAALAVQQATQTRNVPFGDTVDRRILAGAGDSVSPDGRLLSISGANFLTLHDIQTGEERRLAVDDGFVFSSAFSRDGRWLAYVVQPSGSMELRVSQLNGTSSRTVFRANGQSFLTVHDWTDNQHALVSSQSNSAMQLLLVSIEDGSFREVAVSAQWNGSNVLASPDGRYAAYTALQGRNREARIILLESGADAALLPQSADDSVLGWAPDGKKLIFRSNRAGLGGYDIWWTPIVDGRTQGIPERIGPSPDIYAPVGVTRQGGFFYARSNDSDEVFLSDLDPVAGTLSPPKVLSGRFAGTKTVPIFSPQGDSVLFVAGNALHFHDLSSGNDRELKPELVDLKRIVTWSHDGRTLYESAGTPDGKRGLFRIDAQTGKAHILLQGRMDDVALSEDANILYSQAGFQSGNVISRNLRTGEEKVLLSRPHATDVRNLRLRISPDGKMLAMLLSDAAQRLNSVAVMPVTGGEPRVLVQVRAPERFGVGSIAWSPDMRYIYAARTTGEFRFSDHSEIMRVPLDGSPATTIGASIPGIVRHLSLSPSGRQILYQCHRETGEVWALEHFLPQSHSLGQERR